MNNEIKEILEELIKWYDISQEDFKPLLDYIINLQEENINIKQQLLENKISLKDVEYQEKLKYKSRNEKAIELINARLEGLNNDDIIISLNNLGNILNGDDK